MDEILDIVNENDEVVGQELRSKIYNDGLQGNRFIRVANIFVFNDDGLLLLPKRSQNRRLYPNCYDFSCGEHVLSKESYDNAAERGVKEELGLEDKEIEFLGKLGQKDGVSGFMQIYKIKSNQEKYEYDKDGIQKLKWFKISTIIEMIKKEPNKFKGDLLPVLKWYLSKGKEE